MDYAPVLLSFARCLMPALLAEGDEFAMKIDRFYRRLRGCEKSG
jgi:hypothetical protein